MNRKKILQAELLQMSIDNEKIKEQRVGDFKNPNKPPPVPPQYRTTAEIQADSMEQQKMVIDNLRSLGIDFSLAVEVSQQLKTDIAGGDGNFLKFNKNFPYFKEKIEKTFNPKSSTSAELINKIKDYFDDVDNSIGLTLEGTKSTTFFTNKPIGATSILASREMYQQAELEVDALIVRYTLDPANSAILKAQITNVINSSPTDTELADIDLFPNIEKNKINRMIGNLIDRYHLPTSTFINEFNNGVGNVGNLVQAQSALGAFGNVIGMVNTKSIEKLRELGDKIREEQAKLFAVAQGLAPPVLGPVIPQPINPLGQPIVNPIGLYNQNRQVNKDYVQNQINTFTTGAYMRRLLAPETQIIDGIPVYNNGFKGHPPTIDGNPPNLAVDDSDNVIYEELKPFVGNIQQVFRLRNGQVIDKNGVSYNTRIYNPATMEYDTFAGGQPLNLMGFLQKAKLTQATMDATVKSRYTRAQFKHIIEKQERPVIFNKIDNDQNYDPAHNPASMIYGNYNENTGALIGGYGIGRGVDERLQRDKERNEAYIQANKNRTPEERAKIAKESIERQQQNTKDYEARYQANQENRNRLLSGNGMKKKKYKDDSSSDEEKIHIDINSHNGKNYKMGGDGFIKRRIKIGKGIEINKDEPKFRAFGKYIIHMLQLHNNNVLNFKHKSGGTIPSIKPVEINDNFKDFILDVLDSGRVNDRHFGSLTDAEKNHFIKVVRGAGIIQDLKLKQSNHDAEKEEMNRLELLVGEINAGNDNEKMIKEAKTLIKKYVSNGRISRQKGFDMLAELE